jgi:cytochrome P450
VSHPDLVREVLVTKGKSFRKWERNTRVLASVDGNGLINSEGDLWRRQRRLVQPAFRVERMRRYSETIVVHARRAAERWRDGETIEIDGAMTRLTLEIIARLLIDLDLAGRAGEAAAAVRTLGEVFRREMTAPVTLPDWLPLPAKRRKREAIAYLDALIRDAIRERRSSGEDRGDILSMLLLAADQEGDGGGMSDEQARDETMTLFNAGHDTSAAALAWTWALVARHPNVQRALVEEAERVLGERDATFDDLAALVFTGAVVREAMRLYPPAWGLFAREALENVEIGGFELPRGTCVFVSPWVMHRDTRWFPDPERFDPERFLSPRAEALPHYAYLPFGVGPHACIGEGLAIAEMTLIVATVVRIVEVEPASGKVELEPEPLISLRPKGGVHLRMRCRATRRVVSEVC